MDYAVRFAPEPINDSTKPSHHQYTEEATMSDPVKVAKVSEIPLGGSQLVELDSVRIALFNLDGQIYAIEDVCTHDGGPLVEGAVVNGCQVECPRHGARFDIRTGAAVRFPAFEATTSYVVRIDGDDVWLERP
jgi:3-phenylpropionate/trans-cinnamate dioxygenase ferredoxin subunit